MKNDLTSNILKGFYYFKFLIFLAFLEFFRQVELKRCKICNQPFKIDLNCFKIK